MPRFTYANVAATTALVVAIGGTVAVARAGERSASTTIKACASKQSGVMRRVGVSQKCKKRERAVTWNRVGEPGPAGPAGAPAARMWAKVNHEGVVVASSPHIFGQIDTGGPGSYFLYFPEFVDTCAVVGNVASVPELPGLSGPFVPGTLSFVQNGRGATTTSPLGPVDTGRTIRVSIEDDAGSPAAAAFAVAVFC